MKKLFSLVLAMIMVMSLATVAFAAEGDVTIGLNYTVTGGAEVPTETLNFVVANTGKPEGATTAPTITVGTNNTFDVGGDTTAYEIPINHTTSDFTVVGDYTYTVTMKDGGVQAVGYDTSTVAVLIQAYYDENTEDRSIVTSVTFKIGDEKFDDLENTYDTNTMSIEKEVTGNLGIKSAEFDIDLILTSKNPVKAPVTIGGTEYSVDKWTQNTDGKYELKVDLVIKEGSDITAVELPLGVEFKVVEDARHLNADDKKANTADDVGYSVTYTVDGNAGNTGVIDATADNSAVKLVNDKSIGVDTGITLDSLPFVLILAVSAIAGVLFVTKRRSVEF